MLRARYLWVRRYAAAGGYTPAEQERREWLRLEAAERFSRGESQPRLKPTLKHA